MRNGVIKEFSIDASEDNVIPTKFWGKGYKIDYKENAEVYVLNPQNFKDWVTQKKRNIKGHINLKKAITKVNKSRKNSFIGEAIRGVKFALFYPKNVKEFFWTLAMFFARLYVWILAYYETKIKKKEYKDGWREEETPSTKPLD